MLINEHTVDDQRMSTCPAACGRLLACRPSSDIQCQFKWSRMFCGRPLGRIMPPGVIHRAVGDELFAKTPASKNCHVIQQEK